MKVDIVIPNFNGVNILEKNLPVVLKVDLINEVIIVDDGSTDNSVEFIRKHYPRVKVVESKINRGFAVSVNRGFEFSQSDLVLLLNSDVVPERDSLRYLLPHFDDKKVFAVGCFEKSIEGEKIIFRGRGIGSFQKGFLIHQRGEIDKNYTLWVSGGAGIFRKNLWTKLGGLDTIYHPYYWEDIDLSYRALKSGYKVLFERRSVVTHSHELGAIKQNYSEAHIKSIAYRNQILFVWLNITDTAYIFSHILYLPYHLIKALFFLDAPFLVGVIRAFICMNKVIDRRRKNKSLAIIPDRDVLKNFSS